MSRLSVAKTLSAPIHGRKAQKGNLEVQGVHDFVLEENLDKSTVYHKYCLNLT